MFPHLVPIVLPLSQISLTGSIYTTMAVASERLFSVSKYVFKTVLTVSIWAAKISQFSHLICRPQTIIPHYTSIICSFAILIFSIFLNSNKFLEFYTETVVYEVPHDMIVRGGRRVEPNVALPNEGEVESHNLTTYTNWTWATVRPTSLRTNSGYTKVVFYKPIFNWNLQRP